MELLAGALLERPPGPKYTSELRFAELAPQSPLPKPGTLAKWRQKLPDGFELALRAPETSWQSPDGPLRPSRELDAGIRWLSEAADALQASMPTDAIWVRDVTLSNSMWGNRMLQLSAPNKGVHALGGGIGQGVPMALGAACAANGAKTILLTGDGGLSLCMGELVSAAEQEANVTMILMNDQGYGVIRNIQDAIYGGRKYYSNIFTPNFASIADAIGVAHVVSDSIDKFRADIKRSLAINGFSIVEVDMIAVGPFGRAFAGPPQKS